MLKPDGGQGAQPEMGDEAGAVDNRLTLNPNDPLWADTIKDWKDGERYGLAELGNVDLLQISPGEFEVVKSDEPQGAAETNDAAAADAGASAPAYGNPAVAKMMGA